MENFTRDNSQIFSMEVDDFAKVTFLEMARWTKFLSILGFICLGFMVILGVLMGMVFSTMSSIYASQLGEYGSAAGIGIMLMYILVAGIMFYPTYTFFKYSTTIKVALNTNNKQKFNEAIRNLKNTFKFYGIMAVISLGLSGLFFIISLLGVMSR